VQAKAESVGEYGPSRLFSTEIKGDLLILFHKNPGLIDTFDGVARRIGRVAEAIEQDVRDLVAIGVLRTRKIGAYIVIVFNRSKDNEAQESIVNHLRSLKNGGAFGSTGNAKEKGP
jgi:hypothetical protein